MPSWNHRKSCSPVYIAALIAVAGARVGLAQQATPAAPTTPASVTASPLTLAPVPLDHPATALAVTEDGKYVIVGHEAQNLLTIYDIATGKIARTVGVSSPRFLLCRGGKLYVACNGQGKIAVISTQSWELENEALVGFDEVNYLTAPAGNLFKDELLAVCHLPGDDPKNVLVNIRKDTHREVGREFIATISLDGQQLISQERFHLSGRTTHKYTYESFLGQHKDIPGNRDTPGLIFQARPGPWWFGAQAIYSVEMATFDLTREVKDALVVPDVSIDAAYVISNSDVTGLRLQDGAADEVGKLPVVFSDPKRTTLAPKRLQGQADKIPAALSVPNRRGGNLATPCAITSGDQTVIVIPAGDGVLLGKMPAMKMPTGLVAESGSPIGTNILSASRNRTPLILEVGKAFTVPITPPAGYQLELVVPQAGMTFDGKTLTWTPTADDIGSQMIKFKVNTGKGAKIERYLVKVVPAGAAPDGPGGATASGKGGSLSGRPPLGSASGEPSSLVGLALPKNKECDVVSPSGRAGMLILSGTELRITDPTGTKVAQTLKLPREYRRIAERLDSFLAISTNTLDVLNKQTGAVTKSIPLGTSQTYELALLAGTKRSLVTVHDDNGGKTAEEIAKRLYDVNEVTGEMRKVPTATGQWVVADPVAARVYVGLKFLYEDGIILDFNVGMSRPDYGHVDMLQMIDLSVQNQVVVHTNMKAGTNGSCVRVSPDGKIVAYVSAAGNPIYSYAIPGFDTEDPSKTIVTYSLKGMGFPQDIAFHPSLPLAFAVTEQQIGVFDRNTGDKLPDKVAALPTGANDLRRCWFSPDGKSVLIDAAVGEERRLIRLPLQLTSSEISAVGAAPRAEFKPDKTPLPFPTGKPRQEGRDPFAPRGRS